VRATWAAGCGERLALPLAEWRELLDAVGRDAGLAETDVLAALEPSLPRMVAIALPDDGDGAAAAAATTKPVIGEERWLVTAVELLPRLLSVLALDDAQVA